MRQCHVLDVVEERDAIPADAHEEIISIWEVFELGNYWCHYPFSCEDWEEYPNLAAYFRSLGFNEESDILIHRWW